MLIFRYPALILRPIINRYVHPAQPFEKLRVDNQSVLAGLTPSVILEIASRSASSSTVIPELNVGQWVSGHIRLVKRGQLPLPCPLATS